MGAHHDSYNNSYDDIRQQKYSILYDMKDYKHKRWCCITITTIIIIIIILIIIIIISTIMR